MESERTLSLSRVIRILSRFKSAKPSVKVSTSLLYRTRFGEDYSPVCATLHSACRYSRPARRMQMYAFAIGRGSLWFTKRFRKIQSGSRIGSYVKYKWPLSGPSTLKLSIQVQMTPWPGCDGFRRAMWSSMSRSRLTISGLLVLFIFSATVRSDCHLYLYKSHRLLALNAAAGIVKAQNMPCDISREPYC